jgi:predicted histone-like DNA-binding protein
MGIPFKRVTRVNPQDVKAKPLFYPALVRRDRTVTLEDLVVEMKDKSSLSEGDIRSVIVNFVEAMLKKLYDGKMVNIKNFGSFSVAIHAKGAETREECKVSNITGVKINYRASNTVRPSMTATRAGQRLEFFDTEKLDEKKADGGGGGGAGGGDDDDDDNGYMG